MHVCSRVFIYNLTFILDNTESKTDGASIRTREHTSSEFCEDVEEQMHSTIIRCLRPGNDENEGKHGMAMRRKVHHVSFDKK